MTHPRRRDLESHRLGVVDIRVEEDPLRSRQGSTERARIVQVGGRHRHPGRHHERVGATARRPHIDPTFAQAGEHGSPDRAAGTQNHDRHGDLFS